MSLKAFDYAQPDILVACLVTNVTLSVVEGSFKQNVNKLILNNLILPTCKISF